MHLPLFPLNAVLCPGGKIGVRVFEQRYLSMIKRCLKQGDPFAIVLAKSDIKAGLELPFYSKATVAAVVDFDMDDEGLLNLVVEGVRAVHILGAEQSSDGLWIGHTQVSSECAKAFDATGQEARNSDYTQLGERGVSDFEELVAVLRALTKHPAIEELELNINFKDPEQVSLRLVELLPLKLERKQTLFELTDPLQRISKLVSELEEFKV